MKCIGLFMLLLLSTTVLSQSEDEIAIRNTVDRFFEGMRRTDSTMIRETIEPQCFLKSIFRVKSGEVVLSDESIDDFIKSVGTPHEGIYDERLLSYDIKIDGEMGVAWTPYEFYVDDHFSHCGVNVFTLLRRGDTWKIIGITDTRRKLNCK